MAKKTDDNVSNKLEALLNKSVSPLDLLPHDDLREKFIDLIVNGEPHHHDQEITRLYSGLENALENSRMDHVKVVVFGGGTGLSNIIGGDCRSEGWSRSPFSGLKEIFPQTTSVVCVADDGGSTGELLKDLPLIAIGDIRHVLLSSIQLSVIQRTYQVSVSRARAIASELARLFNYRFDEQVHHPEILVEQAKVDFSVLPRGLGEALYALIESCFEDPRLSPILKRSHCLGNLIVVASIFKFLDKEVTLEEVSLDSLLIHNPISSGLQYLSFMIGAGRNSVLPCTSTPGQLRIIYSNGVQIKGESKSSSSRRGVPVDSVHVDFYGEIHVYDEVLQNIAEADILILAPGSLYSSIIPVFKVPGLAEAVRNNSKALKLLISNLWVQAGETDLSIADPERKFHVSDMIRAYERNIPGGVKDLFSEVLCLSLKDVPASVIQRYAVEGKSPIYLDRDIVRSQGFIPVECGIYSKNALAERGVIQHDPAMVATAVKVLYAGTECFEDSLPLAHNDSKRTAVPSEESVNWTSILPNVKYHRIAQRINEITIDCSDKCRHSCSNGVDTIREMVCEIIWKHHDIPLEHLDYFSGIQCVDVEDWHRNQQWDNVYTFYDPTDNLIKIRQDQFADVKKMEVGLLIAIGESLLGNYALKKQVRDIVQNDVPLGKVYHLTIRDAAERTSFFTDEQFDDYLKLARMYRRRKENSYTRLINGKEGFTPPGLLMGLTYAWYLDNSLTTYIEHKMSVMKIPQTDLIPEQKKIVRRRQKMIKFFREVVFR